MDLSSVKERIKRESKKGDFIEACRIAGVAENLIRIALQKDSVKKLSMKEMSAIEALLNIFDKRIELEKRIAGC